MDLKNVLKRLKTMGNNVHCHQNVAKKKEIGEERKLSKNVVVLRHTDAVPSMVDSERCSSTRLSRLASACIKVASNERDWQSWKVCIVKGCYTQEKKRGRCWWWQHRTVKAGILFNALGLLVHTWLGFISKK